MKIAIEEAIVSRKLGDDAIGAVVVKGDEIISKASNRTRIDENLLHHAEMIAIDEATGKLGKRHIEDCVLYTTHEPCSMCSTASVMAKMQGVVYGATIEDMREYSEKNSNENYSWRTFGISCSEIFERSKSKIYLIEGFMREECKKLFHDK